MHFTARGSDESASDDDDDSDGGGGPSGHTGGDVARGALEALPGRIDPASAGGPVALPAAGSVMRGRVRYTARDAAEDRSKELAERGRIMMNTARPAPAPAATAAGAFPSQSQSVGYVDRFRGVLGKFCREEPVRLGWALPQLLPTYFM
jgi:hypothetical protein